VKAQDERQITALGQVSQFGGFYEKMPFITLFRRAVTAVGVGVYNLLFDAYRINYRHMSHFKQSRELLSHPIE
jgi:hypothetical protein